MARATAVRSLGRYVGLRLGPRPNHRRRGLAILPEKVTGGEPGPYGVRFLARGADEHDRIVNRTGEVQRHIEMKRAFLG